MVKVKFTVTLLLLFLSLWSSVTAVAQGTAFTYQGKLTDSGNLVNGNYDLQFKLFDALSAGTQQGSTVTVSNVTVSNGIFTVPLDFGACPTCFDGSARFLEIAVRPSGGGSFTTLTPRQPITSSPYAINAAQLGGLAASGFLQNGTSQQAASNFNISGDGTAGGTLSANFLNATTRFNLGGQTVLSAPGSNNLFAGIGAGNPSITGGSNAFFGSQAGNQNTNGSSNSFFGSLAGQANTTGFSNAFFGNGTGSSNSTGFSNAFFGAAAGGNNTTGSNNAFFGDAAGLNNSTGQHNTFIGDHTDFDVNSSTSDNTLLGFFSRVTSGITNATAIGSRAQVAQSNALVLGGITGTNGGTSVNVGIGTPTPQFRLDVVGDINTSTQYNLGGSRVLSSVAGTGNLFVGLSAGTNPNNTGTNNAFFGTAAGQQNTTGGNNAFFGAGAGNANTTGTFNAFFGTAAGQQNTTGSSNTSFGFQAGFSSTSSNDNSFFGFQAGIANTSGGANAFFGRTAGIANTTGNLNAFFGADAGHRNTTGFQNTFLGMSAGFSNTSGNNNTLIGSSADVGFNNLSNATAIGYLAQVAQSNSLILGSINSVNFATTDTNVGIGTTTPTALLDVQRDGTAFPETARFTTFGTDNKVLGRASGGSRSAPTATPFGRILLQLGATGHDGSDFATTPRATIQLTAAEAWTPSAQGTLIRFNTTAIGTTNTNTKMIILDDGSVGIGTASPADLLHVNGIIRVQTLGAAGSTSLCRNASNQIATCSSSLRYKTAVQPFTSGLEIVKRLRPITFTWKQSGIRDLGFAAEEVAKVEPLFTFTNDKGEVEGVKYDRLSVVLINAVKEQQQQLEHYQNQLADEQQRRAHDEKRLAAQQHEIDTLKRLVCLDHPKAAMCKANK